MSNIDAARRAIQEAIDRGARDFCVCAGSRNAPLIAVVAATDVRTWSFVDERSAAFFALGRAKVTNRPAAVITTSGTAVAELLPAAVEAHYSGTPLILITADRPARYRGTAAPQAIEQQELFGVYATGSVTHVNVEFDEPLIMEEVAGLLGCSVAGQDSPQQPSNPATKQPIHFRRPLVILGRVAAADRGRVREWALRLNAPVYAEPLSGLREDAALRELLITAGDRMIARGGFDGVVRIGGVPALRFWRDLDESRRELPVVSFSDLPFAGLSRGEVHPIDSLPEATARDRDESFFADDREKAAALAEILNDEPQSELAMFRALSREVAAGARVYLGNSLPIREWDLAATREARGFEIEANRGANGIDGQLSTFFGQCDAGRGNVAVVGDLTAIYDANASWIAPQLDAGFRIIIVNNGGGRIFERVGSLAKIDKTLIVNEHALRFDHWSRMWGIADRVTELRPDGTASRRVWERYDALWALR